MITLASQSDSIELHDDLIWADEFAWAPVRQSLQYSLTGALIVQESSALAGRPITLAGGDDRGWIPYATVKRLYAMAQSASADLMLTLADGRQFACRFSRAEPSPITAAPVFISSAPADDDDYVITIRLITL